MNWMDDAGKLVLRLSLGLPMLLHGIAKFDAASLGFIKGMLAQKGLPEAMAYGVYVGEVLAPLLIVIGFFTRPAAAIFAFNMAVAVGLAHAGEIFSRNEHGGWAIEVQGLYFFGAIALVLLGSGRLSVSKGAGRFD